MSTREQCPYCGGDNLQPGGIQSTGKLYFRPSNAKFFTFETGDVSIRAELCMDCGAIGLVGDVRKAGSLTEKVRVSA